MRNKAHVVPAMFLLLFGVSAMLPLGVSAGPEDELVSLAKSGGKPVIADFGLGICQQCKKQKVTLDEIREAYGEKIVIRMVNVGKEGDLTKRYEVELIPTLVFIAPNGTIVLKKVGPLGYGEIRAQLSRMGVK